MNFIYYYNYYNYYYDYDYYYYYYYYYYEVLVSKERFENLIAIYQIVTITSVTSY